MLVNPAALPCADKLGNGDLQVDCGRTCEGCCSEGMEEIGGCCSFCCEHNKEGLDVVIFSTCITTLLLASSIDEVCDELLFLIAEEEVSGEAPLQLLLLKLRITSSSSSASSPFSSLSSVSFIEADNGEFDGDEEEEDNPLLERSRGCWDVLDALVLIFFLSPSIFLFLRPISDERRL